MADRLVAIRRLLTHELQDRRVAAAIVLAELGVQDSRSIKALTESLEDEDPVVRRYVLESLGRLGVDETIEDIVGQLADQDPQVQVAAENALLPFGEKALPELQKLLKGPATLRRRVATLLGRFQSPTGIESLIDALNGSDAAMLDRTRKALRAQAPELTAAELGKLRKKLESRLKSARQSKENNLAAALLQLLGDIPDETVVTRIVQELDPSTPSIVRRAALASMMNALSISHGRRKEAAIEQLLECLKEEDEEAVIRPALRALGTVGVPDRLAPHLQELVEAPTAEARAYAMSALGSIGSPDSLRMLVEKLINGAPPVRIAAKKALLEAPDSVGLVAEALLDITDDSRFEDMGDVLKQHGDILSESAGASLAKSVIDRVEADKDAARPLADTLSRALPEPFLTEVWQRVKERRTTGELAEAFDLLYAIKKSPAFGPEELYALSILGLLKNTEGTRPPRSGDRICAPFAELLKQDVSPPLDARLREEKTLEAKDLFYLGFAFSESRDEDERDFGLELLEEVVERDSDGKYGSRAQNKLKLTQR